MNFTDKGDSIEKRKRSISLGFYDSKSRGCTKIESDLAFTKLSKSGH
jgi:hypothetical protein